MSIRDLMEAGIEIEGDMKISRFDDEGEEIFSTECDQYDFEDLDDDIKDATIKYMYANHSDGFLHIDIE